MIPGCGRGPGTGLPPVRLPERAGSSWPRPRAWLLLSLVAAVAVPLLPRAECVAAGPRSTIDRPIGRGPIFLLGTVSLGGTLDYDALQAGYGANILFRPLAASDFLGPLYDWNTAMILQADYRRVAAGRRLLAADFILRRYASDMREQARGAACFVGLGAGAAEVSIPADDGHETYRTWFSYLIELGYEVSPRDNWVISLKGQWRFYSHRRLDYSGWSLQGGLGIPLPW
jgi:hypothetical protein